MEAITLTRRELFDMVWSTPMRQLAAKFGISDVALKKKCTKHDIPTPGLGYWAKIAAGQKMRKPTFRAASKVPDRIVLSETRLIGTGDQPLVVPEVTVPERLTNKHKAVTFVSAELEGSSTDRHGRLVGNERWSPGYCVRPKTLPRMLRLLQAVFLVLEDRGHEVRVEPFFDHSDRPEVVLVVYGERLCLEVEEKLRRKPRKATAEELKDFEFRARMDTALGRPARKEMQLWERYSDSELAIRLRRVSYQFNGKKSWFDWKKGRLEDQLGQLVLGLEAVATFEKALRIERQREAAECLRLERIRLRGQRLKEYQRWLGDDLERMAERWEVASRVTRFLGAYEATLSKDSMPSEWLGAAKAYAERLNPLTEPAKVPKVVEPADEELERLLAEIAKRQRA